MAGVRDLDELVETIQERRTAAGRTIAVAISGIDCAGKSTLAEALADRLRANGYPAQTFACDELTRPRSERFREPDEGLSYYRDSYAYDELFGVLLPTVRAGAAFATTIRVADWERDGWRDGEVRVEPGSVFLVEGCFLLTPERAPAFDLRLWVDLPLDGAIDRALRRPRDLERMGGPDGVRERYGTRYLPGQRMHLERDRPRELADLLVPPDLALG